VERKGGFVEMFGSKNMKFFLHNSKIKDAEIILLGVPDSSGSKSKRKNEVSKAPDYIRNISNQEEVFDKKKGRKTESSSGVIRKKVHDLGNLKKNTLRRQILGILKSEKIPIVIGGDHSVTTEVMKGVNDCKKNISLVYFDAHPDIRCAEDSYYGSVICDIGKLENFNEKKSIEVGTRAPEREEIENLKSKHMMTITPFDIQEIGIKKVFQKIKRRVGKCKVYLSIDMDVVDPAFAPGVDTPVPGGLSSEEFLYLIKKITGLGLIGMDIVEVSPKHDIQEHTGHLVSRAIAEVIGSL